MPYDQKLAERVRKELEPYPGVGEIPMFGGLCLTVKGHMCLGILHDNLMARVGPDGYEKALARAYTRPMDFTGKPLKGFVFISPKGIATAASLRKWVRQSVDFALTLPPKKPRTAKRRAFRNFPKLNPAPHF